MTLTLGCGVRDINVAVGAQIYTGCRGSDINAGCGSRYNNVAVGSQVYTLIVRVDISTLGVGAGT